MIIKGKKDKSITKIYKRKLIDNLKITNSLNVDFTKFAVAVFRLPIY